mmetsp:Transcript_16904/g.29102  ORF Transcript_16904/g.29102 Transcript_16904/m.29102 type:complete len:97 (+) Transcript_16904:106-396(+)
MQKSQRHHPNTITIQTKGNTNPTPLKRTTTPPEQTGTSQYSTPLSLSFFGSNVKHHTPLGSSLGLRQAFVSSNPALGNMFGHHISVTWGECHGWHS